MSTPDHPTALARPRRRPMAGIFIGCLGVLAFILFVILVVGGISGEEFSPQSFTRRYYSYWQIPILHIQVWPVRNEPASNSVTGYLTQNKFISAAEGPIRWDLVHSSTIRSVWQQGDAAILTRYLDTFDPESSDYFWITWTKTHGKLAALLWPAVARLARANRYYRLPAVFDSALVAKDPKQFGPALRAFIAKKNDQP